MNNKKEIIITAFLLMAIIFAALIIELSFPETESSCTQYLVPENEAYLQASVVSKLMPQYGDKYYSGTDFWSFSTVDENPLKIYDTNGFLYQYLFIVSNETQKLGLIALAANKSLGMPIMAIDDGSSYYLHYYEYDPEKSMKELCDYIENNYPDMGNPEIKDYIHDLFRVSAGFRLEDKNSGDNLIINNRGQIYNLSLTRWNRTTPVFKNYDTRYIPDRVCEWEEFNRILNQTYNELEKKGINLSGPLSEEEMKYFTGYVEVNNGIYIASGGCKPFSLPPVYPEDEPVSKLFPEYGFGSFNDRCITLHFSSLVSDEDIKAEIVKTINESKVSSIQIHPKRHRFYVELPISEFKSIRTDLILDSRPLDCYRLSGKNITIFFNGMKEDVSPLIRGKYDFIDAKTAEIWFEEGTDDSCILQEGKKLDSNEIVAVVGYGYA